MTQLFKRRKPRPDPAIVIEETEYYDEPNYPNRELPFPKPTGSRRKRSLTDFPRNYEVAQEVTDWSSALDFIDKYADRAKEWWNQLMDRLKHDDYNTPASLIDRALGAIPLPASRQPRRTNNMRGRRILSQDVSEVVSDPQFNEVREQVSEGLADELGQVVMRTLDDVAAPIEEALGRPLEESEVLDVHEVVTDIVHETLDQVSEEMTEGIAEPVEEEELEEEPEEKEEKHARSRTPKEKQELEKVRQEYIRETGEDPVEGSKEDWAYDVLQEIKYRDEDFSKRLWPEGRAEPKDTTLLTEADIREFLSIAKDILWTRMKDRGMIQGGGTRTQMDPHYYEGMGELAVSIKGTDSDFNVFFEISIDRLGNAGWHGTGPLGSDGGKAGKLSGDHVRNVDKYEDVADEAVRMVIDFLQLQFDEYGKENLPERQGRRAMKRRSDDKWRKESNVEEKFSDALYKTLSGKDAFPDTKSFYGFVHTFAERWATKNKELLDEVDWDAEELIDRMGEWLGDMELENVKWVEGEDDFGPETVSLAGMEELITKYTYGGEYDGEPGDEVWISKDNVIMDSAGGIVGDGTCGVSGVIIEDGKHAILNKMFWRNYPPSWVEFDADFIWQEVSAIVESIGSGEPGEEEEAIPEE